MLEACGLVEQKFFYPYPDYKFPYMIHSDEMLPTASELSHFSDNFYDTNRVEIFSLARAWPTIINAGLYSELANSFLVAAGQNKSQRIFPLKVFSNNCPRKEKYQLRTEIHRASTPSGFVVKKIARNPLAREHLKILVENSKILSEIYGAEHVAQMKLVDADTAEMEFVDGVIFEDYLCKVLEEGGLEDFAGALDFYFRNILRGGDDENFSDDLLEFNLPNRRFEMDVNFRNIILREKNFVLIDSEFLLPALPKKFVAWRAFNVLSHNRPEILHRHGINLEQLHATLKISPETLERYRAEDWVIAYAIADEYDRAYRKNRRPITGFKFD